MEQTYVNVECVKSVCGKIAFPVFVLVIVSNLDAVW